MSVLISAAYVEHDETSELPYMHIISFETFVV